MKLNLLRMLKQEARRLLVIFVGLEILLFLLPTTGNVEGHATGYWDGVKLRLLSGTFWGITVGSGIGAILLLIALLVFSTYMARFASSREK